MLSKWIGSRTSNGEPNLPLRFSAGEIMIEDDPYSVVIDTDLYGVVCSYCIKKSSASRCSRCSWITYCSKDCKRKDKLYHDLECKVLQSCAKEDELPDQETRLVIRALDRLIRERREKRESVGDYFGCRRTIRDLVGHLDHLGKDERRQAEIRAQRIFDYVKNCIDTSLDEVLSVLQRCRINCHSLVDHNSPQYFSRGRAVYLGVSKMNHGCGPTDYVQMFDGRKYTLRALCDIQVYDPLAMTVHYIPPTLPLATRQTRLLNNYYFICNCAKCVWQSRHPEPVLAAAELVARIEQTFEVSHDYEEWLIIGKDYLEEMKDLPDSNFYVYWLLIQLQWTCAELGRYAESIEYGTRAMDGAESVLSLEPILFSICESMVKLGWNKRQSNSHQRFLDAIKTAKDLYVITHGGDHKIVRSLDVMRKGGSWWRKIFRHRDISKYITESLGKENVEESAAETK
ncbi:SET and MYND domain-containing protein 1-like [Tropilaelaps mercedesae]|uniref:SET and MYND domain-containing protein 1-like n=1 Tax=Tropilaelaps mercedesae TaxID=418985 RepID=A0A1V9XNU7_9ACAR|nr:SET and MYND domain-containing protein 1-like [Tropilaelaps mercedesae]